MILRLVIKDNKAIKICGNIFVGSIANPDKLIVKFINKRYHQSLHKGDFKTSMAMIDYILDKENEKEALESKGK